MIRILVPFLVMLLGSMSSAQEMSCEEEMARAYAQFSSSCASVQVGCQDHGISSKAIVRLPTPNNPGDRYFACRTWNCPAPGDEPSLNDYYAVYLRRCGDEKPRDPVTSGGPSGGGGGGGGGGSGSGGGGPPPPPCPPGQCCDTGSPNSIEKKSSIVSIEHRALGESVPLTGINFNLYYYSAYQAGRLIDFKVSLPLAGPTPRDYITSFNVVTSRNGVTLDSQTISNTANQTYTYNWNGLDSSGNPVEFEKFTVTSTEITPVSSMPWSYETILGHWDVKKLGLGGWTPTVLTHYDLVGKRIYFANGESREVVANPYGTSQLFVPAGTGGEVYIFDLTGRHVETKTGLLGTTKLSFSYDGTGRLMSVTEPFGRVTTFNRNLLGTLTSITAPNGQVTSIVVDSNGYTQSITNPKSETYSIAYYGTQGLLYTFTKPNSEVSTFIYDSDGFLTKDSHSGGYFFDLVKNLNGQFDYDVSIVSAMGRQENIKTTASSDGTVDQRVEFSNGSTLRNFYAVNGDGSTWRTTEGQGFRTEYSSAPDGRFQNASRSVTQAKVQGNGTSTYNLTESATVSDPNDPFSITALTRTIALDGTNSSVTTVFNPASKKFTSTTYMGKTSESTIDTYERVVSAKTGNLNAIGINYTNENITSITQGARTTSIGYNSNGLINTITNPLSQTTSYVYDSANRIASKIFPDSRTVTYGYDGVGNLTSVTPPGKPIHQFDINAHGLVGSYQPPALTGVSLINTTYTYNLDKQLTNITRPDGGYINFNYNATTGRLESIDTASGTYTYNMDFDANVPREILTPGPGIQTVTNVSGAQITGSSSYSYASSVYIGGYSSNASYLNRITDDSVQSGGSGSTTSTINYLYNNDGELSKAGDINITYHVPNGYITGTTMGTGTTGFTDTYTYNTNGEVTGYQAKRGTTVLYDLVLTRDGSGRIAGKTQTMNSTTNDYVYGFDSSGRLQQVSKNAVVVSNYGYDSNSNRISGNVGAQTTTATYDDQDRLKTYNTLSFTYNANGDLLTKTNSTTSQTTTYTYDVFGNLTKVILPGATPTTITYEIDGLNRRVGKKVGTTVQRRFVYMDQYRIAAELNSSGTITKRFIYGSKGNIPDYMIASGVKYRIISDQLGSPRLVVKQSDGTISQRMDHDEYGRVIEDTNPGFTPFGFAGGLYDYQTGIVRFGARDYDPEYARWTSKDPTIFNGGDSNLYGYVMQDPINFRDPRGEFKVHGNYCGGNWTGGKKSEYNPGDSDYLPATDKLDSACETHDICYYMCRNEASTSCDRGKRKQCFDICDSALAQASSKIYTPTAFAVFLAMIRPGGMDGGFNSDDCTCKTK